MRLSVACIVKGDTPSASTGATTLQLGIRFFTWIFRMVFLPNRKKSTHTAETAWERMVASAAPLTPMWNP